MTIALEAKLRLNRAPENDAERFTVRQLKLALNRLGYYTPHSKTGMSADIDAGLKDSLYAFQRKTAIFLGDVDIGPGSTTERMLNEELSKQDDRALYIWRTVGDGKVRGDHAGRAGQRFSWNAPPDGENPGEDYNCRCWAELVVAPYHPWIEWVEKRHKEREIRSQALQELAPPIGLKVDPVTQLPALDAIEPVSFVWDTAGLLIILKLGGIVPLPLILQAIKTEKFIKNARTEFTDKKLFKRPEGIPDDWIAEPVKKDIGMIYTKPGTKNGTYVRINKGDRESTFKGQRYDYVRWQKNGQSLDINGNPVPCRSLESHIPLNKFKFDLEKTK